MGGVRILVNHFFENVFILGWDPFFMHMWYYYVVKKVGCRWLSNDVGVYRRSGSNYSLQLKIICTSTSCDTLVAVTQHMTELAAGGVYTATPCTLLSYYIERVMEQVDFRALFICGYTIDTTLTQLHHSRIYTSSGIFSRIPRWSLFGRITAEVCLLALRQPAGARPLSRSVLWRDTSGLVMYMFNWPPS